MIGVESINLTLLFVINIFTISAIGILITNFAEKMRNKKFLLYFTALYTIFLARNILYIYMAYAETPSKLAAVVLMFLGLLTMLSTLVISYNLRAELGKKFSLQLSLTAVLFIVTCSLHMNLNSPYITVLHLIAVALYSSTLNLYVVRFLIRMRSESENIIHLGLKKAHISKWFYLALACLFIFGSTVIIRKQYFEKKEPARELVVYNWVDYFDPETLTDFENLYGTKIVLKEFDDENTMLEEIRNNPKDYDVVIVSDALVGEMIKEGLITPIHRKHVPNLKNLDPKCLDISYNAESVYAVGYMQGTTGIAYNKKYVNGEVNSWEILWNPKYRGKIAMLNSKQEVVGAISKFMSGEVTPRYSHDIENVSQLLIKEKENIVGFLEPILLKNLLVSEDVWIAQMYSGDALAAKDENENIEFILPKEGGVLWIDNFAILAASDKKYTAETFINYMLEPKVGAKNTNYVWFASCNKASKEFVNEDALNAVPSYSKYNELDKFESLSKYGELDDEMKRQIDDLWEKLIND